MADKSDITAIIIPARGGSKRLPRKNVLPLAGKPLIAWTIEAAIASGVADEIIVTSDDNEILDIASRYDVTCFKRPSELAEDNSSTVDVVIDAVEKNTTSSTDIKTIILLQPTSPLREAEDIVNAKDIFDSKFGGSVISVCEVDHPIHWCGSISDQGVLEGFGLEKSLRSQDCSISYRLNGAIYIATTEVIKNRKSFFSERTFAYEMPRFRSYDIDDAFDFFICEALLNRSG